MLFRNRTGTKGYRAYADKVSIIAEGMVLHGDVESESDIRIDGIVNGSIVCKSRVVVIATGAVYGDVTAPNVDVYGRVSGNIKAAQSIALKAGSEVNGDLETGSLQIEADALLNGRCTMPGPQETAAYRQAGLEKGQLN